MDVWTRNGGIYTKLSFISHRKSEMLSFQTMRMGVEGTMLNETSQALRLSPACCHIYMEMKAYGTFS